MTNTEILTELDERITDAERDVRESHKIAMNSYGAGYDRGFVSALREIRNMINDNFTPDS